MESPQVESPQVESPQVGPLQMDSQKVQHDAATPNELFAFSNTYGLQNVPWAVLSSPLVNEGDNEMFSDTECGQNDDEHYERAYMTACKLQKGANGEALRVASNDTNVPVTQMNVTANNDTEDNLEHLLNQEPEPEDRQPEQHQPEHQQPEPTGFTLFDLIANVRKMEIYKTDELMKLRNELDQHITSCIKDAKTFVGQQRTIWNASICYLRAIYMQLGNLITEMDATTFAWQSMLSDVQSSKKYVRLIHFGLIQYKTLDFATAQLTEMCGILPPVLQPIMQSVLGLRDNFGIETAGLVFIGTILCNKKINYRWGQATTMVSQQVTVE
jgi:hypothetical protein